ncbi:MAG: AsmA-like C-terminal domain-containing protein [Desulfurivibrionaceae bacterium]
MSKRVYITSLIIISFGALIFLGPRLLDVDTVRSKVAEMISVKSGWRIDAAQLDWHWLPTPYFSLHDTTISKNTIRVHLPETRIFPLWRSLLRQKLELRRINLVRPELTIGPVSTEIDLSEVFIPHARISVTDGTLIFAESPFAGQSHLFPLSIDKIQGEINLDPEQSRFQLASESSQFNFMNLEGVFSPGNLDYQVEYELNGLNFYNLLPALEDQRLLPVKSAISLRGEIDGRGIDRLQASLTGDFPCFVAPSANESFLLDCGGVDLDINKNGGDLSIEIRELQLKNPGMILSGAIARRTGGKPAKNREPVWLVDLTGRDLDLTALRKGVLALWGDNQIAKTVTDIVLGGKASRASYYFEAPLSGFRDITEMTINVDVQEARIHPPFTPLFLEKARGVIKIDNGYLSGEGLSARLDGNRGNNCSLFLDLAQRENDFELDLDIAADLADLGKVLPKIVPHPGFRREVERFSNIEGRASGHLHIGESLDDPRVTVRVDTINGGAAYEPIPHPFRIRSGGIDVFPDRVEWRGVKGVVGPHLIREFSGETSLTENPFIEIKSAQATFDSAVLLAELKKAALLPDKISQAISKAEGVVELNRASVSGLFREPGKWQYSLDISTSGSKWSTPLLPHPLLAERIRAKVSRGRLDLDSGKVWLQEQPLLVEGSFFHSNLTDWRAWIMLSGTIREPLAEWIGKKDWLPDQYFPVIPCTLDKFKVEWDDDKIKLSGGIAAGMGEVTSPSVRLELESDRDRLKIDRLIISSPEERGVLSLDYQKKDPQNFKAKWQGFINSETVLALMRENILPAKRLEGDFSVAYSDGPAKTAFTGWAKVTDLAWLFNKSRENFLIKKLDIIGADNGSLKINQAVLVADDEELALNGQVTFGSDRTTFDLGLAAEEVSSRTGRNILADLRGEAAGAGASDQDLLAGRNGKELEGVLHFRAAVFRSNPEAGPDEKAAPDSYILSPAQGFVTVDSGADLYTLDLRNSRLCNLEISATLNLMESKEETYLNVFTDSASPPLFEDVIPCLGFENTLVTGDIHLDVNLKGVENRWQSGNADLYSNGGYIHRLSFLSKVFRVVNLRDILSGTDLPDYTGEGFAYSKIEIDGRVADNHLHVDKAFIDGAGLNIFGQGVVNMGDWTTDLTLMVAPLKTMDALITKIPLIGRIVGGADEAVISIPVGLKGKLRDPKVTILPPEAIGEGLLNLVQNTLRVPFRIISPLLRDRSDQ